ncbi:MAG TPA: lipoyl(octanoyl) transferase LipB [Rubricoccaceae bacterium]|jgi:lipoyl(octanoyl) transferase
MQRLDVFPLGRVPYAEALAFQRRLQAELVAARHEAGGPAHALLVVEHDPVFTLGASGDAANVLVSEADLAARGATFARTDRGGDVTFHGPGQTVAYPILDLGRLATPGGKPLRDLHRYLRALEDAVVATCAGVGVAAGRVAGRTGVWVGPDARGPERKVCAMGIRCSRWVTMHGLALNVTTDLAWFDLVVPCGIADRGVTSLEREVTGPLDRTQIDADLVRHLAHHVGAIATVHADGPAALAARLAGAPSEIPRTAEPAA